MISILYPVNELKIGGAEQQLLNLVRGIDKTRFRPIVAPLYPNGALDAEFRSIPGVDVIDMNRNGKYDPSPLWRIAAQLRRHPIDVVQPFLSPATFFGLLPALAVGTSVTVVTERCGVRRNRGMGYKVYRTVEDWISHLASAIVSNSVAGKDLLIKRGLPDSIIRVIYNGVDEYHLVAEPERVAQIRSSMNVSPEGTVVGILASLTPAKGHDTLLQSIALVSGMFPDLRLAIVGDGPCRNSLEARVVELGLVEKVFFFGYQREVADYLAAFDILISASSDNEGCSNSILEAMSIGIPVIATDIGGNRELVHHLDTGFLVPVADPKALALAIGDVRESPHLASTISNRARNRVTAEFGLDRMVREYETLYIDLLAARGAHVLDADGRMVTMYL